MSFNLTDSKKENLSRPSLFQLEIEGWEASKLLFYKLKIVNGRVMEAACYDNGTVLENLRTITAKLHHNEEVLLTFTSFRKGGSKLYEFTHPITRLTYSTIFDWEELNQILWWKLEFPVT